MARLEWKEETGAIPGVRDEMRRAAYWIARAGSDSSERSRRDAQAAISGGLLDLEAPTTLPSPRPAPVNPPRGFRQTGRPWTRGTFAPIRSRVLTARPVAALPAVAVERVSLRVWPTAEPAFRGPDDREFDQWQVTRIHLMDCVRILAETVDGRWLFVAARIAAGWVPASSIAPATAEQWQAVRDVQDPVVVGASGVTTEPAPYDPAVSRRPLEFGAWLLPADVREVSRQHPMGHVGVLYPVRNRAGWLSLEPALLKDDGRVSRGFRPFARASVLTSAFTQLGDRYDWGDRLGNHDCSSLVMDAYRTVGVQIPRNSGVQSRSLPHRTRWSEDQPARERISDLMAARPGDLLHMAGHVLLYLGMEAGVPYALHALVGYGVPEKDTVRPVIVNAVEVSTVTVPTRGGPSFLEVLTGVSSLF